MHDKSGHSWQDPLYDLIRRETYVITKEQIVERIKLCEHCMEKATMATCPPITPIIAKRPRERYLANLVDFCCYHIYNKGYNWMFVMVDSFSKFAFTVALEKKLSKTLFYFSTNFYKIWSCPHSLYLQWKGVCQHPG